MNFRIGALIAVVFVSALSACGGGGGGSTPTPSPPSVTVTCPNSTSKSATTTSEANALCAAPLLLTISPTDKAASVSVDTASIDVTTDSVLDSTTLTAANISLKAGTIDVVGTVAAVGTKAFKFSITGKLNYAQPYTFTATVKDTLGRALVVNGAFTTAAIPQEVACAVAKHSYGDIAYPDSYKGAFAIPVPNQKLPTNVIRSVGFKDYYPGGLRQDDPCKDRTLHARNLYVETLDRLQNLGVDQVWIYNYGPWDDFTKPIYKVNRVDWQIPESEMIFLVNEAKKRNIKTYLSWQFLGADLKGNFIPIGGNLTSAELKNRTDSYHPLMVEQALFASQIGISGISADWDAFYVQNLNTDLREQWVTEMVSLITDMRKVFAGKIVYGSNTRVMDTRIAEKIDSLIINLSGTNNMVSTADNVNLSVGILKNSYLKQISDIKSIYDIDTKNSHPDIPVTWYLMAQSKNDIFINGWSEDGFCVQGCIQKTYITDFSVQAIGVEAALEAITEQTKFKTGTVSFNTGYWHTDDITPTSWGWDDNMKIYQYDFPNLSQSIRNKPAEGIVKYWFGR